MGATTTTTIVTTPDRRELCVESAGDSSGRPVLMHGGSPNSRLLYGPLVVDAEAKGIHLISYDRPGYGRSTAQPGRSVADCADDVRAIAAAFGIERLAVWGVSGGGPHALACAALLPDLVSAVASLASVAPYGVPELDFFTGMGEDNVEGFQLLIDDPAAARQKTAEDREDLLQVTPELLTKSWESLLAPVDLAALTPELATILVDSMKDGLEPGEQGWWDDGCATLHPWGFEFEATRVPVQLWHGAQDKFVPFQHGQWLAAHIPGVEAHLTETDGHLTLLDRVPEVHDWLLRHK
jgi:pimeloyl-ACP methyl ester carboxylesterase